MKQSAKMLHGLRLLAGWVSLYLPLLAMGLLALGSWWLVRNTPVAAAPAPPQPVRQTPDYWLTNFVVKNFDAQGQLASEVTGVKAKHVPATDILEIDQARMVSKREGRITRGQGDRALSNGDGTEVQLIGNAVVIREASAAAPGQATPRIEVRGDFLHAFLRTEEVKSHKPVTVTRGTDRFSGDVMLFNNIERTVQLDGRVRVTLEPKAQ